MRIPIHWRSTGSAGGWLGLLAMLLLAAVPPITMASTTQPTTPPATRPDDEAKLAALGKRDIQTHDPSTIVKEGDTYWFFGTGHGVDSFSSKDLQTWQRGPSLFDGPPAWVPDVAPRNRGHFWAPDVIRLGDRWAVYYSVSQFGRNTSGIALATSPTLDSEHPDYGWTDEGVIIQSRREDNFNAIDPAITRDEAGRLWMSFGSFWTGIKMIELDPETGRRIADDSPIHHLAAKEPGGVNEIEAPAIYFKDGYYYLFVNWDLCCRGVESTYNIRVGRSRDITGPYLDKQGKDLRTGGGSLLLETDGPFIGPGHAAVFKNDGRHWLSVHFYDATENGAPRLAIRPLSWDEEGWPVVGEVVD